MCLMAQEVRNGHMKKTAHKSYKGEGGILGIDAGGTFTDIVFMNGAELDVAAKVKTPTDHNDLIITIREGLSLILEKVNASQIREINLATTLATNAIVENKLRPVGLVLIGYDEDIVRNAITGGVLGTDRVARIKGGHTPKGNEIEPLDEKTLIDTLRSWGSDVEGVALSSYFSVRNPHHELRAVELTTKLLPETHVTCGHELASELDAIKRATTTALNAGLIPIVMDLLASVEEACRVREVIAPIMVVRGDGSLVSSDWAKAHPVEMILSGPASSACGAGFLADAGRLGSSSWAIDIGGTTTDIIHLDDEGKPISTNSSTVGNHKTLVKAIDIQTFGLGGDSRVHYDVERKLIIGPRRVRPLCVAAHEHPEVSHILSWHAAANYRGEPLVVFPGKTKPDTPFAERIIEKLQKGPQMIDTLLSGESMIKHCLNELERMELRGVVSLASFTPTDALHVLGLLDKWDRSASLHGANIMLLDKDADSPEDLALSVRDEMAKIAAFQLFSKSFSLDGVLLTSQGEGQKIVKLAFEKSRHGCAQINLRLNAALVGLGAPAWAFIHHVGNLLDEQALLPEHAEVAGAVGAAVGIFSLSYAVQVMPRTDGTFRVHHPLGVTDYTSLEQSVTQTHEFMMDWLEERARKAGAANPSITYKRTDEKAWIAGGSRQIYLWTHLSFTVSDKKDQRKRR